MRRWLPTKKKWISGVKPIVAYELAIFDLDGTILDTLQDLADSVNHALISNSLKARSIDEIRSFVGNGIRKLIERSVPSDSSTKVIDKVYKDFCSYYMKHCSDSTKPYDGIAELFASLKAKGIMVAIVSNKADEAVQVLCNKFFSGLVSIAVGEHKGINRKPSADMVNMVLRALGVSPCNSVYIGDSEVDILTAENSKMPCISVTWGFKSQGFLLENGAKQIANTTDDVLELISSHSGSFGLS